MTRLLADQVRTIPADMPGYDQELISKTGCSLRQIAAAAAGTVPEGICTADYRVAVIPVESGQGLIGGFSNAVEAIASYLGFRSFITSAPDVRGLVEAYSSGADLAMLADDHVFAAINLNNRKVADNDEATARGYAVALDKMAGSLKGKKVLLIGAGRVGKPAASALIELGADLLVYDLDKAAEAGLALSLEKKCPERINSGLSLEEALAGCSIIFDASPGHGFIREDFVSRKTLVAAPGIPLGLSPAALKKVSGRLIHDPLQIGTAVMLFKALA
jgi:3-methylornithyl-N6-L-lysine dehydrogenase